MKTNNIHASCVDFNGKGVLITGKSKSGKSDITLRLISIGGVLVSDDRTILSLVDDDLYASPHEDIKGLIEIRGLGIKKLPFTEKTKVVLVVNLIDTEEERCPEEQYTNPLGKKIPLLCLNPFYLSSHLKVKLAIGESL